MWHDPYICGKNALLTCYLADAEADALAFLALARTLAAVSLKDR
jgi:hypothetical protein